MKNKGLIQPGVTNVTDEAPLPTYMIRRGAVYAVRRVVPEQLRPYLLTATGKPRTEFVVSLGTKDRREATSLAAAKNLELQRQLDDAQRRFDKGIKPGQPNPRAEAEERWLEAQEQHLIEGANLTDLSQEEGEWLLEQLIQRLSRPEDELSPEDLIIKGQLPQGYFDPPDVIARREEQFKRDWDDPVANAAMNADIERYGLEGAFNRKQYPRLQDVFNSYAAAVGLGPKTLKSWQPVILHLVKFLGHDDASKVMYADLKRWRDFLKSEVTSTGNPRATVTIRERFIAAVRAMYNHACEEEIVSVNPAINLKIAKSERTSKLRGKDFTPTEATTILRAATHAQTVYANSRVPPERLLARRWIPWLCAYTGARVNELTQLRLRDIQCREKVWVIVITPEAGTVKNGEARIVPLHSHLIEQGFTELSGAGSDTPLFYNPNKGRGGTSANPHQNNVGESLAKWVRELGITDKTISPNHAWRHTFRTLSRRHGLDEGAVDSILGHAPASVGRRYGSWPLETLAEEIEKIPRFQI